MKKTSTILVLMGPMGSGKTTIGRMLAEELGWPFYDADDFHSKESIEKMRTGAALTDEDREPWLRTLRALIRFWLENGQSTILACSALKRSYRNTLGVNQTTVRTVYLKGSHELLLQRIADREHEFMNKRLLRSQLDTLEEPADGLIVDVRATPAKIVSIIIENLKPKPGITEMHGTE